MKKNILLVYITFFLVLSGCIEEKDTEIEQPSIELLLPKPCDTLYFGESFLFRAKITDNTGLGNISMDVHNNFGHHNHGSHETCSMDETKEAIDPFFDNWIFSLSDEKKEFVFDTLLSVPFMKDDTIYFDSGDYHFHIYVTDNEGYQIFTTFDVKVLY